MLNSDLQTIKEKLNETIKKCKDLLGEVGKVKKDKFQCKDEVKTPKAKVRTTRNKWKPTTERKLFPTSNQSKNIVVTGIPNNDINVDENVYDTPEQTIPLMISKLDKTVSEEDYEVTSFPSAEGGETHTCKRVFSSTQKMMR